VELRENHVIVIFLGITMTQVLLGLITFAASNGNIYSNLSVFHTDAIFYSLYSVVGSFLFIFVYQQIGKNRKWRLLIVSFIYFYSAFACFTDGYAAGWSHTSTLLDKLFFTVVFSLTHSFTVVLPIVFLLLSGLYSCGIYLMVKRI